jgi:hypothetical protein
MHLSDNNGAPSNDRVGSKVDHLSMKIKIAINSFLFHIENAYGIAVLILILLRLSGLGLAFGGGANKGDDYGPGIGFST